MNLHNTAQGIYHRSPAMNLIVCAYFVGQVSGTEVFHFADNATFFKNCTAYSFQSRFQLRLQQNCQRWLSE